MKKLFLLSTTALLFSGVSFAQTGKDDNKAKAKDSTTMSTAVKKPKPKTMPKSCPGKTCGKDKS